MITSTNALISCLAWATRVTASLGQGKTMTIDIDTLSAFIVRAKAATYVGDGEWAYHESYFGGAEFIGEEVVYFAEKPIWAMNYYGYVLRDDLLTGAQAGQMIKASLSGMYQEGRFLGGFQHKENDLTYVDASEGNTERFHGREIIRRQQELAYELLYHGGMIRD